MLRHPQLTSQTKLTGVQDGDMQPNAVDLRLETIFDVNGPFILGESNKIHRKTEPKLTHSYHQVLKSYVATLSWRSVHNDETIKAIEALSKDEPDARFYILKPGHFYEFVFANEIDVPEDEAGFVIIRSTLVRNGLIVTGGLYDSGYGGKMGAGIHVAPNVGYTYLMKGARVGQYLSFAAESTHAYNGTYGRGKDHDKKYEQ